MLTEIKNLGFDGFIGWDSLDFIPGGGCEAVVVWDASKLSVTNVEFLNDVRTQELGERLIRTTVRTLRNVIRESLKY